MWILSSVCLFTRKSPISNRYEIKWEVFYFLHWSTLDTRTARKFSTEIINNKELIFHFRDYGLTYECIDYCTQNEAQCIGGCINNSTCSYDCAIEAITCKYFCPCADGCPEVGVKFFHFLIFQTLRSIDPRTGCENCPNDFCSCHNYEENPDYIGCEREYELVYWKCVYDCGHNDNLCYAACNREYDQSIENCPCKSECPNGCPCPDYECPQTTPEVTTATSTTSTSTTSTTMSTSTASVSNTTVLVLSSYNQWKPV